MEHLEHYIQNYNGQGPTQYVSSKTVGAGITLSVVALVVLWYLVYAQSQARKRSWVNTTVNLDGQQTSRHVLVFNLLMYVLCSSLLLVINKVTVGLIPMPGFVLFAQMLASVGYVKVMESSLGLKVDKFEKQKVLSFIPVVAGFVGMLFTNMKALQHVPVDTFICARASTTAVIAIVEYMFLGRALPSLRSWVALGGLLLGVYLYVNFDYHFSIAGYMWIGVWYCVAVAEMVVVKHVCTSVKMSTWGRTLYMNGLALVPITAIGLANMEALRFQEVRWDANAIFTLLLSCLAGIGMSYYSFSLRAMISATSFSLVGNICKIITILVNIVIWDKHAGTEGIGALLLCLAASGMYQQAPMRAQSQPLEALK